MARVLIVDDERDLVQLLQRSMTDDGHEVFTAYDGQEGLSAARLHQPNLVILDVVIPRLDGLQVCQRLRQDSVLASVLIIFLTVMGTVDDCVAALDIGGDDYLIKPVDLRVLRARTRALLRRSRCQLENCPEMQRQDRILELGPLALDMRRHQVRAAGRSAQLTPAESKLLQFLLVHAGEIFSGKQLLDEVWGYLDGTADPSLARWHILNLRAKIEPDPAHPQYLRTIPRYGYILDIPGGEPSVGAHPNTMPTQDSRITNVRILPFSVK